MWQRRAGALLLASFLPITCCDAAADPVLIAVGFVNAATRDMAAETAGLLESGVPGNRLGGIGSGLAHAGGDTFLALPDRGPNAAHYNACVDDTTSYITRFHTFRLALTPSPAGAALPFTLSPALLHTTLLSSPSPLVYGSGGAYGTNCGVLRTGAPVLNAIDDAYYFTGRSDAFDPARLSTNTANGRFDPESIRVANDGRTVFISDEYGPDIYEFSRLTGMRTAVFAVPDKFGIRIAASTRQTEVDRNSSGRLSNRGLEGLALTPDGRTLVAILQSPLLQDGGITRATTRMVTFDVQTRVVLHEYAYGFDNIGTSLTPRYGTVGDILALNDHEFLVSELDAQGLGDDSAASMKRVYKIDVQGAADIGAVTDPAALRSHAVPKSLFLDVVAVLTAAPLRMRQADIPAKLEGLAFGDDVTVDGIVKHTLYVSSDNDFVPVVTDSRHPAGFDNPNTIYVFGFDVDDLQGSEFIPQRLESVSPASDCPPY